MFRKEGTNFEFKFILYNQFVMEFPTVFIYERDKFRIQVYTLLPVCNGIFDSFDI